MINALQSMADKYELVWSGDPALDVEAEDFKHRFELCRDGKAPWSSACRPGAQPTIFVFRVLGGEEWRQVLDYTQRGGVGQDLLVKSATVFRVALLDVVNLPGCQHIQHVKHPEMGWKMASVEVTNLLDSHDLAIVNELGNAVFVRQLSPPPK